MEKLHLPIYSTKFTPVKNHPKMASLWGFSRARPIFPAENGFSGGWWTANSQGNRMRIARYWKVAGKHFFTAIGGTGRTNGMSTPVFKSERQQPFRICALPCDR
jgi:hypothetical protein